MGSGSESEPARSVCPDPLFDSGAARREHLGAEALLDLLVEVAAAQTPEHRVVLGVHHFADAPREVRRFELIGVAALLGREDRPTVIEVGDDVRMRAPTVLGLDVEQHAAVTNVRIEAREHPGFRPPHETEAGKTGETVERDTECPLRESRERAVSLRDPQRACNDSCLSARSADRPEQK